MSLGGWLQEQLFERRIVLVTRQLDDARFHLSQPTAWFSGTLEEISAQSRQQQELLWKLYGHLARRTGRPAEEIAEDMRRGRYLDAREALDYGLIDEINAVR
jgi:ATP-dependent Clp protease protease subunit